MMKKFFVRCFSLVLAFASVFSLFTVFAPTEVFAAENTYIKPGNYRLESAAKSNVMWNLYGNYSASCTKICTWKKDNSSEQIAVIRYEGDGAYRIYYKDHPTKCTDVLRYTSPLKNGQKVELYEDTDDVAQLLIPYKVNSYTVIFTMKANPSLAISVDKTSNGSQLVLRRFNASDKKQQWVFRSTDSSFKKVNPFTTKEPNTNAPVSAGLTGIPKSAYKVNGTYTIYGKSYTFCTTTKNYNGVKQGTKFYLEGKKFVQDQKTLNRLATIHLMNDVRNTYISTLKSQKTVANEVYTCTNAWVRNQQMSKAIGTAGGAALRTIADASMGNPVGVFSSAATFGNEMAEAETVLSVATVTVLRSASINCIYWCDTAIAKLQKPFTDYSQAVYAAEYISEANAWFAVNQYLGRPILDDAINSNPWSDTFVNIGLSVLEGTGVYDILDIVSDLQNTFSMKEFIDRLGIKKVHQANYDLVYDKLVLG